MQSSTRDWCGVLENIKGINKTKTIEFYGTLPKRGRDKIVLVCECGGEASYAIADAELRYLDKPYRCRKCSKKGLDTIDYKNRLKNYSEYSPEKTFEKFGYLYPKRSLNKVIVICRDCNVAEACVLADLLRRDNHRCKKCRAKAGFEHRREAIFKARNEYWSNSDNRKKASKLAKTQKWRGKYFKEINTSERITEIRNRPDVAAKIKDGIIKDWIINRNKRLDAAEKVKPQRIKTLKETVNKPEHRALLSKLQREKWLDPEYKQKQMDRWTPEERERMRQKMAEPEIRVKLLNNKRISRI